MADAKEFIKACNDGYNAGYNAGYWDGHKAAIADIEKDLNDYYNVGYESGKADGRMYDPEVMASLIQEINIIIRGCNRIHDAAVAILETIKAVDDEQHID